MPTIDPLRPVVTGSFAAMRIIDFPCLSGGAARGIAPLTKES
jgi:hypothetical protein